MRWRRRSTNSDTELSASAFARREIIRSVGQVLWRFRKRSAAALVLLVASKLLAVSVPVALKAIVDQLTPSAAPLTLPVFLLLGYALLRFASGLFTELRDLVFVRVTQTAVADYTLRMFEHLHAIGVRFHGSRQTGMLARDVQRGTAGVGFLLGTALFTLLPTVVEIGAVLVIMVSAYHLGFAGIVGITFLLYAVYTVIFTEKRMLYQRHLNEIDSQANGRLVDSLVNYETVKFYTNEQYESSRLRELLRKWIGVGLDNQKALSALHVGQSGIIAFGVGAVMVLAGQQVVSGDMVVGDLVLVNAYIIQICLPLNTLGMIFRQAREALVDAERMTELLKVAPEASRDDPLPPLVLDKGVVEFQDVKFSYDPGRPILHGVSFRIEAGDTVAVVGGSGSGKSTLSRLLLRFYEADEGRILLDGQDITSFNQQSLRSVIGVVPQDSILFNDTIAYNIAYGRPGASLADVIEAAKGAKIHDLIQSLPLGYDTLVGERGIKLSGGERQRIAIARAMLKNPPLLVFDEATSALDTRTERDIQIELDRLAQGRSTLTIAHRLSTIVDADLILVMEHGQIAEQGTHDALLQLGGLYAQMWNLQRQQQQLDATEGRLTSQPVNLVPLVAGVMDALRPIAEEKGIVPYTLITRETTRVTGDPSALQQLVFDLCENAIAFTPPAGRIEIRLERQGDEVVLSITDGRHLRMDEDTVEFATPASVQVRRLVDPLQASALVQQMNGRYSTRISPDGGGQTSTLYLPLREWSEPSLASRGAESPAASLSAMRICITDDDPRTRDRLATAFQLLHATVETYDSGSVLLETLRLRETAQWPDVLICSIALGEPDGFEVIGRIRQLEADRGVPLIERMPAVAMSTGMEVGVPLRAMLAGFQVHVGKPVDLDGLLKTVRAVARPRVLPKPDPGPTIV